MVDRSNVKTHQNVPCVRYVRGVLGLLIHGTLSVKACLTYPSAITKAQTFKGKVYERK